MEMTIGALLRERRLAAGLTQELLAERAGISVRSVQAIEHGTNKPLKDTVRRLSGVLGLSEAEQARLLAAATPAPRRRSPPAIVAAATAPRRGPTLDPPNRSDPSDPSARPPAPRNPFKGLRAFRAEDAGDFFGRESLIAELAAAVRDYTQPGAIRFLGVIGPSGSGKSSAVLAGLLPGLRGDTIPGSGRWVYLAPLTPGAHPLEALSIALANALPPSTVTAIRADLAASERGLHLLAGRMVDQPDTRVVLVVDQAEELFTLAADEDERRRFIDLLVTAVSEPGGPVLAVLTLRADSFHRLMSDSQLGRLVIRQSVAVLPMEPAELRAAIEGPIQMPDVDLRFDEGLVGNLLYEVWGEPGALPLLQFTLDQLFERRDGRLLTCAAYQALGGVRGALARHAAATYQSLPDDAHRALARALFLRLIEPGVSLQDTTRRRAPLAELDLADATRTARLRAVAEAFIAARLLTALQIGAVTMLEVSHEALIPAWGRLGEWLDEAREDIRRQGRISADAAEWARHGRPMDSLYRGTLLATAREWAGRNTPSALETAFLDTAAAEGRQRDEAERTRQARELALARRAATRLRTLVAVLALFLLAAAGLTALAVENRNQAEINARQAQANARQATSAQARTLVALHAALSRAFATQAGDRMDGQYDLALLLSLEARGMADTVEARDSVLRGLEAAPPGLIAFLPGHSLAVSDVSFSPNGKTLVSVSQDGTMQHWDVPGRRLLGPPLAADAGGVYAFNRAGALLASANGAGGFRLWDAAHHHPLGSALGAENGTVTSLAFSPHGATLAVGGADDTIHLWDVSRRRPLPLNPLVGAADANADAVGIDALAFSPDGAVLASGSADGAIQLWDTATGESLAPLAGQFGILGGHTGAVTGLAFSPDGALLASAGRDGAVRLWDVARQRPIGVPLIDEHAYVLTVAFSPDGHILAAGGQDGAVRLWDVRRRRPLGLPLVGHTGAVDDVVFSPDGTALAAATSDGTVALWDVRRIQHSSTPFAGGLGRIQSVAVSPDGHTLAVGAEDGAVRLWDLARGRLLRALPIHGALSTVAFSPDSRLLAVGTYAGDGFNSASTVRLWDVATGRPLSQPVTTQDGVNNIAFSPDDQTIASAGFDGTIQLWSVTRQPVGLLLQLGTPLIGHTGWVRALAFSPDGRLLASGGEDRAIRLWDVRQSLAVGPPLVGHSAAVRALAFSPDGKILASASDDHTIRLWSVDRRQPLGQPLTGHTDAVFAVAFSPDGAILASGGADFTVRLWDVAGDQSLGAPLTGHSDAVTSLAFSPNGATLLTGSWDGAIRRWDVDLRGWPARACGIANRNLTRQEWRQYAGDLPYRAACPGLPVGS